MVYLITPGFIAFLRVLLFILNFVYFKYGGGLIRHLMFFNKGYKCLEGLKLWLEVFPLPYN